MMQGRIWVRNEFKLTYDRHGTMKELGIKNEMFKEGNQTGLARHGERKELMCKEGNQTGLGLAQGRNYANG